MNQLPMDLQWKILGYLSGETAYTTAQLQQAYPDIDGNLVAAMLEKLWLVNWVFKIDEGPERWIITQSGQNAFD